MDFTLSSTIRNRFCHLRNDDGKLVVLTGAGISAESGIPTFRGKDGYWVVGSKEYQPQEMATHAMFRRDPSAVWAWYLYRRGICNKASPNEGHHAVVALDINIDANPFSNLAESKGGLFMQGPSASVLPNIVTQLQQGGSDGCS